MTETRTTCVDFPSIDGMTRTELTLDLDNPEALLKVGIFDLNDDDQIVRIEKNILLNGTGQRNLFRFLVQTAMNLALIHDDDFSSASKFLAKVAFEAYNNQAGGKTWDGKDIPPFEEVGEKVQANWYAAAEAILCFMEDN